jgi:carboxypeptidase Q
LTQAPTSFNVVADIKGTDKADELVVRGDHLDSWHLGKGATDNAEEGLLASRAFIDSYFINRPIAQTKAGHSKLSAYFNVDNGTGAIRGVYMQGNTAINPIFDGFMAPLKSLGMTTLSARSVGGRDHVSFDGAGRPGFQFIQDPIEYETRTHHTDQDAFERLLAEDLTKNASNIASFACLTAYRDEPLPRKPLPRSIRPAGSPVP